VMHGRAHGMRKVAECRQVGFGLSIRRMKFVDGQRSCQP